MMVFLPRVVLTIFLGMLAALCRASPESTCGDQKTCEDANDVRSSAMLQVTAAQAKRVQLSQTDKHASSTSSYKMQDWLALVREEARLNRDDCISHPLKEARLLQFEQQTARLAKFDTHGDHYLYDAQGNVVRISEKETALLLAVDHHDAHEGGSHGAGGDHGLGGDPHQQLKQLMSGFEGHGDTAGAGAAAREATAHSEDPGITASLELGITASLNAAGFKAVTSLCCPAAMEQFFNRLLASLGLVGCSKPHIQGLMHWFHCVPNMDFQYVLDVIENGNPCKYWARRDPLGSDTCPQLSPQCIGHWCR